MCVAGWIFDSVLLAGVAITVHYSLIQYLDKKVPPPKFLSDAMVTIKSAVGMATDEVRDRMTDPRLSDTSVYTRRMGSMRVINFLQEMELPDSTEYHRIGGRMAPSSA